MSKDTTLIYRNGDLPPISAPVHERFMFWGHQWAVTQNDMSNGHTIEFADSLTVTHIKSGRCAKLIRAETVDEAKEQFFEQMKEMGREKALGKVESHSEIEKEKCPYCGSRPEEYDDLLSVLELFMSDTEEDHYSAADAIQRMRWDVGTIGKKYDIDSLKQNQDA